MYDIVIIGAGVTGLSAAIAASERRLRVVVLERDTGLSSGPGETLHPGIEPLLSQFGIREEAERAATGRHGGIIFDDGQTIHAQSYGGPARTPWRGYHIPRQRLHELLLQRSCELGATVLFGHTARSVHRLPSGKLLVETANTSHLCDWLFDGGGVSNWLSRIDRTGYRVESPQFIVCYGYKELDQERTPLPWPKLTLHPWGWEWRTELGNGWLAWAKLFKSHDAMRQHKPPGSKSADGTWRVSFAPAQDGMFRIGDAAFRLDPSSGKGVLRAMMSALMAVHLVKSVEDGKIDCHAATEVYSAWITAWFDSDVQELRRLLHIWDAAEQHEIPQAHSR